jgi:acyl-lipid omega-6 desaturase (Delta-12 desaturase)
MQYSEFQEIGKKMLKTLKPYSEVNHKKAFFQILTSFLPFLALFAVTYMALSYSYVLFFALAFLNAFFLVRIFIIQHDCGHNTFVASNTWRSIIGFGCSLISAIPYQYWAKSHQYHHNHTGQLELRDIGDINTLTVKEYEELTPFGKFKYRLYRSPLVMFVLGPLYYWVVVNRFPFITMDSFKPVRKFVAINNLAVLAMVLGLSLLLSWKTFLATYFVTLYFFYIIAIWFFFVQHQHEETYKQWKKNWTFFVAAIKGSTYYKLPGIVHWLTGNIGVHHIHHLNATIPSYNLMRAIKENPWLNKYTTQITFWESLQFINNKLWDEELQKMISFREYRKLYSQ